ncbi:MAG: RING-box protein 2, partial [Marteilia pararefringens]
WFTALEEFFDLKDKDCAICKFPLDSICNFCQDSESADECRLSIGKCTHMFHSHCINQWTDSNVTCPLDNLSWKFKTSISLLQLFKTAEN